MKQQKDFNFISSPPILNAKNITKTFLLPDKTKLNILSDVNLQVNVADSIAILGSSGSGKTTLLSILAGLELPTAGQVLINGEAFSDKSEDERAILRGKNIGFIFQSFQLIPTFTAFENTLLPLEISKKETSSINKDIAIKALQRVGLSNRLHHYPNQLSGGEQQRVAIARAFAIQPKLLFADEPTGNLDHKTGLNIVDLLMEINAEQKTTLILVTHDQYLAKRCKHNFELIDGVLTEK